MTTRERIQLFGKTVATLIVYFAFLGIALF